MNIVGSRFGHVRWSLLGERLASEKPAESGIAQEPKGTAMLAACAVGIVLLALAMLGAPTRASARIAVGVSVSFGPPALPIYAQPPCPGPGYIWTPGYWAWDPGYGYYWVPGTWVVAPFVGALWTPGYWGYDNGMYVWFAGYWGPRVGYYGGINYGYGYTGFGYYGGYWNHDRFYYNRTVNNIRTTNIRYVYNQRVRNVRYSRVSYNGGPGGINVRPTREQLNAARSRRFGPVSQQEHQREFARNDPRQRASVNRGRPDVAATRRPGAFRGNGAVPATRAGGTYRGEPRSTFRGRGNERPSPSNRTSNFEGRGRGGYGAARPEYRRAAPQAAHGERSRSQHVEEHGGGNGNGRGHGGGNEHGHGGPPRW